MPYSRSQARESAESRISHLRRSFVYAKVRTRKLPTPVRDAIFQNCVFQLSATLEDYISAVIKDWLASLASGSATNAALPERTRAFLAAKAQEEAFKRYIGLGDEGDLADRTIALREVFHLLDDTKAIPSLDVTANVMSRRKFPTATNLEALFKRLGVPGIVGTLSKRTKINTRLSLQAFMDIRNALAHESPPSITDVDVGRYFGQVKKWVGALDRELYSHVIKTSGHSYWN